MNRLDIQNHKLMTIVGTVLLALTMAGATCSTRMAELDSQPSTNATAPAPAAVEPTIVAELYVSPTGRSENSGTINSPLDLESVFSGSRVRPGTLVWLLGGTYVGTFESYLKGTERLPIIVRQYPGERAVIDGSGGRTQRENAVLAIFGEWTNYWGFEVTNSDPNRTYRTEADRPMGVVVKAPHTKFINMVVHDNFNGFGFWREAVDSELYGNIIFNNGTRDSNPDGRGHGHAVYTQNDTGTKIIKDNIAFNQFGRGINVYPNPGSLRGFHIEGNISFNNGVWQGSDIRYPNILVGGYAPFKSERIVVTNNYTYHSSTQVAKAFKFTGANFCLGCSDPLDNKDIVIQGNYVVGGVPVVYIGKWEDISLTGNTFYGNNGQIRLNPLSSGITRKYDWNNNDYFGSDNTEAMFLIEGTSLQSLNDWRRATGLDQSSRYSPGPPSGVKVFIRPNQYEPGRANIAVYNWDRRNTIDVNMNGVLEVGKQFEVRNVQDYFGTPVLKGTYDGRPLRLPMTGLSTAGPVGMRTVGSLTGTEFNAFVVLSQSSRTSGQTSSAVPNAERNPDNNRERRAMPPSDSGLPTEPDLRKFVGHYGSKKPPGEVYIQLQGNQLKMLIKNEPVLSLVPISPTRFRVVGKPTNYSAEFHLRDGQVASLTVTDSAGRSATIPRN